MQIEWTSVQIMIYAPEYIAERSVWWEKGMKAVVMRLYPSEMNKFPSLNQAEA